MALESFLHDAHQLLAQIEWIIAFRFLYYREEKLSFSHLVKYLHICSIITWCCLMAAISYSNLSSNGTKSIFWMQNKTLENNSQGQNLGLYFRFWNTMTFQFEFVSYLRAHKRSPEESISSSLCWNVSHREKKSHQQTEAKRHIQLANSSS